jgi:hypothetical protein
MMALAAQMKLEADLVPRARRGGKGQPVSGSPAQRAGDGPVGDPARRVDPAEPVQDVTGGCGNLGHGGQGQPTERAGPGSIANSRTDARRDDRGIGWRSRPPPQGKGLAVRQELSAPGLAPRRPRPHGVPDHRQRRHRPRPAAPGARLSGPASYPRRAAQRRPGTPSGSGRRRGGPCCRAGRTVFAARPLRILAGSRGTGPGSRRAAPRIRGRCAVPPVRDIARGV